MKPQDWGLIVILDKDILGNGDLRAAATEILQGGAKCIQLRNKTSTDKSFLEEAKAVRTLTRNGHCSLIINDRADIALACDADGVHLGQDDMPCNEARRLLGADKIIGISSHNIHEAKRASATGADYIGMGPIFKTKTKPALKPIGPDMASDVSKYIDIPSFFIGGITLENITELFKRGGRHVAVASAVLNSGDIATTTKFFRDIIEGIRCEA